MKKNQTQSLTHLNSLVWAVSLRAPKRRRLPDGTVKREDAQGRLTQIRRFVNAFTFSDNGCWQWIGDISKTGYGHFFIAGKTVKAHRVSYQWFVGELDTSLVIDHLCRNRGCVNPTHLRQVTSRENTQCGTKNRKRPPKATHCKRGHEFTKENTYLFPSLKGWRTCRSCLLMTGKGRWKRFSEKRRLKRQLENQSQP